MASTPKSGGPPPEQERSWAQVPYLVRQHPVVVALSVLGTLTTFIVGSVRVVDLVTGPEQEFASAPSYDYVEVSDDTGQISVQVPRVWTNVPGDGWHARGIPDVPFKAYVGPGLNAAPDVEAWREDLETPGVFIGASRELLKQHDTTDLLRSTHPAGCAAVESETFASARFTGELLTYRCDGTKTQWRRLAATPTTTRDYLLYLEAKLVTSADVEAYNKILNTFEVDFEE
jgi:serine protease Do